MDMSYISHNDLIACFFSVLGGLIRLMLNVDIHITKTKQFLFLFVAAMPSGFLSYKLAIDYGFEKAAYPMSYIFGIMALSIVSIIAKNGANELLKIFNRKTK